MLSCPQQCCSIVVMSLAVWFYCCHVPSNVVLLLSRPQQICSIVVMSPAIWFYCCYIPSNVVLLLLCPQQCGSIVAMSPAMCFYCCYVPRIVLTSLCPNCNLLLLLSLRDIANHSTHFCFACDPQSCMPCAVKQQVRHHHRTVSVRTHGPRTRRSRQAETPPIDKLIFFPGTYLYTVTRGQATIASLFGADQCLCPHTNW